MTVKPGLVVQAAECFMIYAGALSNALFRYRLAK